MQLFFEAWLSTIARDGVASRSKIITLTELKDNYYKQVLQVTVNFVAFCY